MNAHYTPKQRKIYEFAKAQLEAANEFPDTTIEETARKYAEAGAPGSGEVIVRRVADVEAQSIRWLWPGRIARGKITMIAGHPELGKSQLSLAVAAVVTKVGRWPVDGTPCEVGSVVILSAEDDVADTIRPRLEAAGADVADGGSSRRRY